MELATRREFTNLINDRGYKTVVEVGVGWGGYSKFLLDSCPQVTTLYAIDSWGMEGFGAEFRPASYEGTVEKLTPFGSRAIIIKLPSEQGALQVPELVDFVYIDGEHSESAVLIDCTTWWPKIKVGGIMSGHDWHIGGVRSAVEKFMSDKGGKIFATGTESSYSVEYGEEACAPSWWIEKSE